MLNETSFENDESVIASPLELQLEASDLQNMDIFSLTDPFALLEERKNGKWMEVGMSNVFLTENYLQCF